MNFQAALDHGASLMFRASWQATILALIVILLIALLRERLTPHWRHVLWVPVVLRLLLPMTPSSPWSLFNLSPLSLLPSKVEWSTKRQPLLEKSSESPEQLSLKDSTSARGIEPMNGNESQQDVVISSSDKAENMKQPMRNQSTGLPNPFTLVWLTGVILLAIRLAWGHLQFSRQLRARRPVEDPLLLDLFEECKRRMGVRRTIPLLTTPGLECPALFGCFTTRLLLPPDTLTRFTAEELRHIFLHELAHVRRGDPAMNTLLAILQTIHWFNPMVWLAFRCMRAEREMASDALALLRSQPFANIDYGRTLIKVLDGFENKPSIPGLVGVLEEKHFIKQRIETIKNFTAPPRRSSILSAFLLGTLALAALTDELPAIHEYNPNEFKETDETGGLRIANPDAPLNEQYYAWSDALEFHRIPKRFMDYLSPTPVEVGDGDTQDLVLKPEFIELFRILPEQARQVNQALSNTLHRYRLLEAQNLVPTTMGPGQDHYMKKNKDYVPNRINFELKPFREDAEILWETLQSEVRMALEPARAELVLASRFIQSYGEWSMMRPNQNLPRGMESVSVYTYQYTYSNPPKVELIKSRTMKNMFGAEGGSMGSNATLSFGPSMDQYAPKELLPILRKWREKISLTASSSEGTRDPAATLTKRASGKPDSYLMLPAWNEESPYLDIPKELLTKRKIAARNRDGGFSMEAAALFGITSQEQTTLLRLYENLERQHEQLEDNHFEIIDAENHRFLIRAFPEEATQLKQQWMNGLNEIVGLQRADLVFESFQSPPRRLGPKSQFPGPMPGMFVQRFGESSSWLERGQTDIEIQVQIQNGLNRFGRKQYVVRYSNGQGGTASHGGSSLEDMPGRIGRHLKRYYSTLQPDLL